MQLVYFLHQFLKKKYNNPLWKRKQIAINISWLYLIYTCMHARKYSDCANVSITWNAYSIRIRIRTYSDIKTPNKIKTFTYKYWSVFQPIPLHNVLSYLSMDIQLYMLANWSFQATAYNLMRITSISLRLNDWNQFQEFDFFFIFSSLANPCDELGDNTLVCCLNYCFVSTIAAFIECILLHKLVNRISTGRVLFLFVKFVTNNDDYNRRQLFRIWMMNTCFSNKD